MKKIISLVFLLMGILSLSYGFPVKDPYLATIIGRGAFSVVDKEEKIPISLYRAKFVETRPIPKNLEYQGEYKFTMALQEKEAPLVFILAGTGASSTSANTVDFQKIYYKAGYHVVGISSAMNTNALISLSFNKMPGNIMTDGMDVYRAIKKIKPFIESKAKVKEYNLMGYSQGATHGAMVSYIDSKEKTFDFKRVFLANPAVNLYDSATILDNMFNENTGGGENGNIDVLLLKVNGVIDQIAKTSGGGLDLGNPEAALKNLNLTQGDLAMLMGAAFRLVAVDVNFLADYANGMGVYTTEPITTYENMGKYLEKINFAGFESYLKKIALPYYQEQYSKDFTLQDIAKFSDLKVIEGYLKTAKNVYVVTNKDELILTPANLKFLENTFKGRIKVYPYGGHCGNMYYKENVDYMMSIMGGGK